MRWVAPTEKDTANETLEKRLWDAADQFRANSGLKAGQYSTPVLGLIFLRFALNRQRGLQCARSNRFSVEWVVFRVSVSPILRRILGIKP